jgi:ribosome-associated heat shock protein Hsp15
VAERRGPASEAAVLYEETEASRVAREEAAAERRLTPSQVAPSGARPTKRDRRRLERATGSRRKR